MGGEYYLASSYQLEQGGVDREVRTDGSLIKWRSLEIVQTRLTHCVT